MGIYTRSCVGVLAVPTALAIWLIARAIQAKQRAGELSRRLDALETEILRLKQDREPARPAEPAPAPQTRIIAPSVAAQQLVAAPPPAIAPQVQPAVARVVSAPAALSTPAAPTPSPTPSPGWAGAQPYQAPARPAPPKREQVPALQTAQTPPPRPQPPQPAAPAFNWEQFMGVKGFAWIGGFALFLGIVFAIQYAYARHLISPALQAGFGFLIGLGVLAGGVVMSRKNLSALSQTLCATGVVILYTVTFSCRSIYRFEFFGPIPTFLLMALITATAILLAVRFQALVVAILGMLGGFLTPILVSTGQDNPLGLFGYIAILDAGADPGGAAPPLAFSRRAGGAGHGHPANPLGGRILRRREVF